MLSEFMARSAEYGLLRSKDVAREALCLLRFHPRITPPRLMSAAKMCDIGSSLEAGKLLADEMQSSGWINYDPVPFAGVGMGASNAYLPTEKWSKFVREQRAGEPMNYEREFEKSMADKWRKSDKDFTAKVKVNDLVQYSVNFLRNTGQVASNDPRVHGKAVVAEVLDGSMSGCLRIVWIHETPHARSVVVHASNMGFPTTPRTCGGL